MLPEANTNNEWQTYRSIPATRIQRRAHIISVIFIAVAIIALLSPVIFGTTKWIDLLEDKGQSSSLSSLILGSLIISLFILFAFYCKRGFTGQPCPNCRKPCTEKEASGSGGIYLVCHTCRIKWDTGFRRD